MENLDESIAVSFAVEGVPAPGGSKHARPIYRKVAGVTKFTRRFAMQDMGKEGNAMWREAVAEAGRAIKMQPFEGPLELEVIFRMPRPASHFVDGKNGRLKKNAPTYHTKAPDTTKLLRSTEDALKGICWLDDAQVCWQHAQKIYADHCPGASIEILKLSP